MRFFNINSDALLFYDGVVDEPKLLQLIITKKHHPPLPPTYTTTPSPLALQSHPSSSRTPSPSIPFA